MNMLEVTKNLINLQKYIVYYNSIKINNDITRNEWMQWMLIVGMKGFIMSARAVADFNSPGKSPLPADLFVKGEEENDVICTRSRVGLHRYLN